MLFYSFISESLTKQIKSWKTADISKLEYCYRKKKQIQTLPTNYFGKYINGHK